MRTYFLHPGHLENGFGRSQEEMFHVGKWPQKNIITLLHVLKCDFGEVDEAIVEGAERPCKLIFCTQGIQKSEMNEFTEVVSCRRMALRTHNLPSGSLKMRLR
jgi:hypothetical protein